MRCRSSISCPTPITSSPSSFYCTLLKLFMFKDVIITCSCSARKFNNQLWISGFIDVGGLVKLYRHLSASISTRKSCESSGGSLILSPSKLTEIVRGSWAPKLVPHPNSLLWHYDLLLESIIKSIQGPNPIHINCVVSVYQSVRIKLLSQELLKCCVWEEWDGGK